MVKPHVGQTNGLVTPHMDKAFAGILFDLDGTLLDTAPDFEYAIKQLLQDPSLPPFLLKKRDESLSINTIRYTVNGGVEAIIKLAFNVHRDEPHYKILSEGFLSHYLQCLGHHAVLFPGILSCLSQLNQAHIPWGIVTNKLEKFTLPLIDSIAILKSARIIVSGDTLAHAKPHPAPLEYACKKMHIEPHKTLYVGDAQRDVQAAHAAHMPCVLASYGYISPQEDPRSWGANYYIDNAQQLSELLF